MADFIERAADLLFPAEGRRTLNVKFLGAGERHVTASSLAEQIVRAEVQIAAGNARYVDNVDAI